MCHQRVPLPRVWVRLASVCGDASVAVEPVCTCRWRRWCGGGCEGGVQASHAVLQAGDQAGVLGGVVPGGGGPLVGRGRGLQRCEAGGLDVASGQPVDVQQAGRGQRTRPRRRHL